MQVTCGSLAKRNWRSKCPGDRVPARVRPTGAAAPGTQMTRADQIDDSAEPREVVRFSDALAAEVLAFQFDAYPSRRADWVEARWRWMFIESAARLGVAPMVWLCRDHFGVVAQRGAIAVKLHTSAGELLTGWCVDTVVLERLRGQSIGSLIVARATADLPVSLSLGQTAQVRALQDRHGWQPVATMRCWLLVLDPRHAFCGRLSRGRAFIIAGLFWSWQRMLRWWRRLAIAKHRFKVSEIENFGAEHDRLWERVRAQYQCAVVRDRSYLQWKYVAQPGSEFRRLHVSDGNEVRGLCVWILHDSDTHHAYRRAWIIDMIVDHTDSAAVHVLLDAVTADAARAGAAVLEFDVLGHGLLPHLRRCGWIRGAKTRQLRVCTQGATEDLASVLRSAESWYATRGDSDGDHPWWTPAGRRQG